MKNLKTCAIIIARQGSSRLPGKALKLINDKPILELIIERLNYIKEIDDICIATSSLPIDMPIIDFAKKRGVKYFAGHEEDVLKRLHDAACYLKADIIYEVGGDCPFVDKETFLKGLNLLKQNNYDFVHNFAPMTYPDGLDCPIITFNCLKSIHELARLNSHRTHPFSYIFTYKSDFKIGFFVFEEDLSQYRLTLDYQEDFQLIKIIFNSLYDSKNIFSLRDIINFLRRNNSLLELNSKYVLPPVPEGYWNTIAFVNDLHEDIIKEVHKIKKHVLNQKHSSANESYKEVIKLLQTLQKRSQFLSRK